MEEPESGIGAVLGTAQTVPLQARASSAIIAVFIARPEAGPGPSGLTARKLLAVRADGRVRQGEAARRETRIVNLSDSLESFENLRVRRVSATAPMLRFDGWLYLQPLGANSAPAKLKPTTPQPGYWITTPSGKRHNSKCRY